MNIIGECWYGEKENIDHRRWRKFHEINKVKFSGRRAHPQTVHNELIKDPRFVLVGRGTYALAEHGFTPGTAREILYQTLKKNGPMKAQKLIDLVLKQRTLKPTTLFLNLHNKKYFKKLADGRYAVK